MIDAQGMLGPAAAGIVAESTRTFTGSYLASGVLTATTLALSRFLPHPG